MSCVIVALEPPATSAGHMTSGVKGLASEPPVERHRWLLG